MSGGRRAALALAITSVTLAPCGTVEAAEAGAVGWFPADDSTAERSGTWPALAWDGAAAFDAGRDGRAFRFDGGNGLRSTDPALGDFPAGPFTLRFDVRTTQLPPAGSVADLLAKPGAGDQWRVTLRADGSVEAEVGAAGPATVVASDPGLADGAWHTVVIERRDELCIVVDGRTAAGACAAAPNAAVTVADGVLGVANGNLGIGVTPFVGALDDLYLATGTLVDLAVAPGPAPAVPAGGAGTVEATLRNPSTSPVTATMRVEPPPGVRFTGADGGPVGCRASGDGAITCDDGAGGPIAFPPGDLAVALRVDVAAGTPPGQVAATARWTRSDAPDVHPLDNVAVAVPITVTPAATTTTTSSTSTTTTTIPIGTTTTSTITSTAPATTGTAPDATTSSSVAAAAPGAPLAPPPVPGPVAAGPAPRAPSPAPPAATAARSPAGPSPVTTAVVTPEPGPAGPPVAARPRSPSPDPAPAAARPPGVTGRPAALDVAARGGGRSGPPGVELDVTGSGHARCDVVHVLIDGVRVGSTRPDRAGDVRLRGVPVPGGTAPGRITVTSSCHRSGAPVIGEAAFEVTPARWHRSGWVTGLPRPHEVSWELARVATSALASVALMALVGFPSILFNRTLDEHYDEIRGWFGWAPAVGEPTGGRRVALSAGFFAAGALLYSLLDPGFGLDASSLVTYTGKLTSTLVALVVFAAPSLVFMRRRFAERGRLRVRPGTLVLGGLCVAASRLLQLHPGYVYGLLAGFVFASEVPPPTRGRLTAVKTAFLLAVGLVAWIAWSAVAGVAGRGGPPVPVLLVEAVLASLFVAGLLTPTFSLLPLHLLDGRQLVSWNRVVWAAQFVVSAFLLIHILLRPSSGYVAPSSTGSMTAALVAFAVFGAASVAFWAFFRFRRLPASEPSGG